MINVAGDEQVLVEGGSYQRNITSLSLSTFHPFMPIITGGLVHAAPISRKDISLLSATLMA